MGKTLRIDIDMDKLCAECREPGGTSSGICLGCAAKAISGKPMKSTEGRALQRRYREQIAALRRR